MTQQITPLPAPPQPSDSPTDFDKKAFALLGGLPQFVDQANALGSQVFTIGEDATESAAAALTSKNAAETSASNSAGSANASGQSASNSASSANAANQSRIAAQNAAAAAAASAASVDSAYLRNRANHTGTQAINTVDGLAQAITDAKARANHTGTQAINTVSGLQDVLDAKASNLSVAQAIAMAATFTAVPATFQAAIIVVTLPHLRCMWWNGTKYVRAPWHAPGVLFFSHAPAASVTHGIQVRADVTYNKADYPDLAEILGVAGSTFILPEGRARVLRAADNGRGIDSALVNGYLQEDAGRNLTGGYYMADANGSVAWGSTGTANGAFSSLSSLAERPKVQAASGFVSPAFGLSLDASRQWPTASEFRVKSLTATLYITK